MQTESTRTITYFWLPNGANGWMSNWSLHSVRDDRGVEFKTAEHYVMWHKAMMMGDEISAAKIIEAETPAEVKKIGRGVKPWNEQKWVSVREDVVRRALELKVSQHRDIQSRLLGTNQSILAEASPYDKVWGIGLSARDENAADPSKWRGLNLLGKQWMIVREALRSPVL